MSDAESKVIPLLHEATLEIESGGRHYESDRWLYAGEDIEVGMISAMAPGGAERWAKFFQAAPAMARALLAAGKLYPFAFYNDYVRREAGWHTHRCHETRKPTCTEDCVETRAALTAAGVPLK